MPAPSKGPHLYLRKYRDRPSTWIIRDGGRQIYLGRSEDERLDAEDDFRNHVAANHNGRLVKTDSAMAALIPRYRPGRIYFITCETDEIQDFPIKIGFAAILDRRTCDLQGGLPWRIKVLGSILGNIDLEQHIHDRFPDLRMYGEWFRRAPRLMKFIDETLAANTTRE